MRKSLILILSIITLISIQPCANAGVTPKSGSLCSKVNQTVISGGKRFICIKSGSKLVWSYGITASNPARSTRPTIMETDDQFLYGTYGCQNKIMYVRFNRQGKFLYRSEVIESMGNYELIPKFYIDGTLLFETFDCSNNKNALFTLDLTNSIAKPQLIYGPSSDTIMDATLDVASKTPLVLVYANGISQVVTGGLINNLLWSGSSTPGFGARVLVAQTGYQFLIFGNYGCCGSKTGFGGYRIDFKQNFVANFAYTPNLYLSPGHVVISGDGWNQLAFATESGIYLCGDPGQYPLNVQTDTHCNLVTSKRLDGTSMAISYGPGTSYDLIAGDTIYNYPFPTNFLTYNEKPIITSTSQNISTLVANNYFVNTFEIRMDLGSFLKKWNYYGTYFSQN